MAGYQPSTLQNKINNIIQRQNYFYICRLSEEGYYTPPNDSNEKWVSVTCEQHLRKVNVFTETDGSCSERELIEEFGKHQLCVNDINCHGHLSPTGTIIVIEYERHKLQDVFTVSSFHGLRVYTDGIIGRNNYFYIGRTAKVSNYIWEKEPDNELWRRLTKGKKYKKVSTVYRCLSTKEGSEYDLIKDFKDHPKCINMKDGDKIYTGVIYVLEYEIN